MKIKKFTINEREVQGKSQIIVRVSLDIAKMFKAICALKHASQQEILQGLIEDYITYNKKNLNLYE